MVAFSKLCPIKKSAKDKIRGRTKDKGIRLFLVRLRTKEIYLSQNMATKKYGLIFFAFGK